MWTEEMARNEKRRRSAVGKANTAVYNGMIIKPDKCSKCSNPTNRRIEGHHMDYDKPLEVIWLCLPCHRKLHMYLKGTTKIMVTIKIEADTYDFNKESFNKRVEKTLNEIYSDYKKDGSFKRVYKG